MREDIAPILTFLGALAVAIAALRQARTARLRHEEQTNADRERRITESFAKAVEQLGSEKLATRLGGIYTLERISQESEREYWPIMETLTAYVHGHARWSQREEQEQEIEPDPWDYLIRLRPAMDVQAILTVLGRREEKVRNWEREDQRLDLAETDLRGANLTGAHLERANLGGVHLERANLMGAYLGRAHLEYAVLIEAQLERTNLIEAHLERADFRGAHLEGADFRGAHLEGADFRGVHLERANFRGACLEGANFRGAHLERAEDLTQEQINSALGNENTALPEGLDRPSHWTTR